jgi:pilus assembly protein Flp/PilA
VLMKLCARAQVWWFDLRRRACEEDGATAVEYAIMVGMIAAVIVTAVSLLGKATNSGFSTVKFP